MLHRSLFTICDWNNRVLLGGGGGGWEGMPLPPRSPRSSPPEHSFRLFLLRNEHQRGLVATRQSGTLLGKRAVRVAWCDWHSCGTQKSRVGNIHEDSQRVKKQVSPAGCDVGRRKSGWLMVAKLVQWMLLSRRGERETKTKKQEYPAPGRAAPLS